MLLFSFLLNDAFLCLESVFPLLYSPQEIAKSFISSINSSLESSNLIVFACFSTNPSESNRPPKNESLSERGNPKTHSGILFSFAFPEKPNSLNQYPSNFELIVILF